MPPPFISKIGHDITARSALITAFTSIEALRAYQRHPQHLAVMAFNDPFVARVASVDFTGTER